MGNGGPDAKSGPGDETMPLSSEQVRAAAGSHSQVFANDGVPTHFAHYRVQKELGRGAFGVVYKAFDPELKRTVALKVLLAAEHASKQEIERFFREAESAARLQHPNIVPIHEMKVHDGKHYYTMDYIEGEALSKLIDAKKLNVRQSCELMEKVARGLAHAHGHGILHRDLKPENIMVVEGEPKITDFGLAKVMESSEEAVTQAVLTQSGTTMGTPYYMSPEQAAGRSKEVDARSDVYSLGCIFYEMLTGVPPFTALGSYEILRQHVERDPVPLRKFGAKVSDDVETICLKCLEKAPERRYQSAAELAADLERFLKGEPIAARRASFIYVTRKKLLRNRTVAAVMGLAIFTLIAVNIIYIRSLRGALRRPSQDRAEAESRKKEAEAARVEAVTGAFNAKLMLKNHDYASDGEFVIEKGEIVEADFSGCKLDSIEALDGLKLLKLILAGTRVWSLEPIRDMPIESLDIHGARAFDVEPVATLSSLRELRFDPARYIELKGLGKLRGQASLEKLSGEAAGPWLAPAEFWRKVDAGDYYSAEQRQCAKRAGLPVLHVVELPGNVEMHLILIPPGKFVMGAPEDEPGTQENERPVHSVRIAKPFYLGRCEVTQAQWQAVMGANPSYFKGPEREPWVRRPVEQVSWGDCQGFVRQLNQLPSLTPAPSPGRSGESMKVKFRFPTEAEWEYACRAGTTTPFHFGETISTEQANYNGVGVYPGGAKGVNRSETVPVGTFPPNAWGLHNMHGNVWEWCEDWYLPSGVGLSTDPKGPGKGSAHLLRGGAWPFKPESCRSASRYSSFTSMRSNHIGFRVAAWPCEQRPDRP